MVVPTPDGVRNPLVLAAARLAGVTRVFTIGGAQAIAALAYGTADGARGRQDLRARQRLCRRGQAPRVRRRRHRHGRRRLRDPRDRRRARRIPTGSRSTSSRRPSTTRWRRRSCSRPMPRSSTRSRRARARLIAEMPRAANHRGVARRQRGALGQARDLAEACASSNRIAPEHLELAVADPDGLLPQDPPRGRDLRRSLCVRRRSATTAPARTTCCRPDAPRASRRRSASTISRSAQRAAALSRARRRRWVRWRRRSRAARD